MGLTAKSTGSNAIDNGLIIEKSDGDFVIALAGNPNVGKSTVFNALTGMNQHTGNWPGKTVSNAQGRCHSKGKNYIFVDIPGTYSLMAHSAEEEVARNFICFGSPDAVVVVCDATCLERNLNLALQTIEITSQTIICVNLLDEAEKKNIKIDLETLQKELGVPVVGIVARSENGLDSLMDALNLIVENDKTEHIPINYGDILNEQIDLLADCIAPVTAEKINARWVAVKLLENNNSIISELNNYLGFDIQNHAEIHDNLQNCRGILLENCFNQQKISDTIVSSIISQGDLIAKKTVRFGNAEYYHRDLKIDRILTSRIFGIPIMLALLGVIFWITIVGANYPSELLSSLFFKLGSQMTNGLQYINAPEWVNGVLVDGIYRVLAWVVSVMLPPMAIFFPLFTLLEDFGYLPRVAFNLDKKFRKCCACGKQSLTMCLGFGCNAAGVVGCRIIDSPRERLIATITNSFVPCNGRFPTIITIITMFFVGSMSGILRSVSSTLILLAVILLGITFTFVVSRILSATLLKGVPSSFTLELPPYRKPQIGKVLIRSIFDRTIFVLGRACAVAAPCGLLIWLMANITVGDSSILIHCANFLDPFAEFLGLDGVILLAFILGFPANEIVVPIIIMAYMSTGMITEITDISQMKTLFIDNGWTWVTAVCTMLFMLLHFPCSTTCMTIKKETQSLKWTMVSFFTPLICGIITCALVANLAKLFL